MARWLKARAVEAYVIQPSSLAVSREHRRAKTDRLDTELLMRALLGWLRGEQRHCSMAAIPTINEEEARRERTRIANRIKAISLASAFAPSNPICAKLPTNWKLCIGGRYAPIGTKPSRVAP
ncbi:hypothetical protein NKJ84_31445 [Mesorhizobium sp. M0048]|uniref:hypothetical protein n=1 Tax=Mesorhizobium sp. M0048 TaxID=2956860 RepID=UPI003337D74F